MEDVHVVGLGVCGAGVCVWGMYMFGCVCMHGVAEEQETREGAGMTTD